MDKVNVSAGAGGGGDGDGKGDLGVTYGAAVQPLRFNRVVTLKDTWAVDTGA